MSTQTLFIAFLVYATTTTFLGFTYAVHAHPGLTDPFTIGLAAAALVATVFLGLLELLRR